MKIAIVGFDTEGRASYEYFAAAGHDITICDQKTDLVVPDGVATKLGAGYLGGLEAFDLVIRTAGLQPRKIIEASPGVATKLTSCTNEFMRISPSRQIIGVTGTKGKGTTSSLIKTLLEAAGQRVHLGGNIGLPALELLKNDITPDDWVVLELSSFQLIDLQQSPHIGVCLMVVPEHLDWHSDEQEYYAAKQQLFRWQTEADITVYYAANERSTMIASAGSGRKLPFLQPPGAEAIDGMITIDEQAICPVSELRLPGAHNIQNVCAAVTAAWQVSQDTAAFRVALSTFSGLPHRLELVATIDEVAFYDDSFGTTPETAIVALEAFSAPKVIILGGSDKGADYARLAEAVKRAHVRQVLLIGDQAARIGEALAAAGVDNVQAGGLTMTEIIQNAQAAAQPGDIVLLSPACASFDMFKDYKDRGEQFKAAAQSLVAAA